MEQIAHKLTNQKPYNEIRIYFGKTISSAIFNGQLTADVFTQIENKLKKSCKLKDIPYGLYNEYCYDEYIYQTNTKNDKLFSQEVIDSKYININNKSLNAKINFIISEEHESFNFNVQKSFIHIQPFVEASLKIGNQIFIKLRKNLYTYDIDSPISSYQVYIIFKGDKNKIELLIKIIEDIINQ